VLLSSGDSFPHLIQKRRSQLGFVTYLLNYLRIKTETKRKRHGEMFVFAFKKASKFYEMFKEMLLVSTDIQ
jgi:hypothetical protein